MLPREYYERFAIPRENNYVFTLFPSEMEKQYVECIKKPLELINTDRGNVICESYLDYAPGTQVIQEIWKGIARANVVIADISLFKPDVMLILGVALMYKESVYIIANEKNYKQTQKEFPFDITQIKVQLYDESTLNVLSSKLVHYIEGKIENIENRPFDNAEVSRLMTDAKDLINSNRAETALFLFREMDSKEPNNWYIHQEWGNAFVKTKDYQKANEKYLSAIDFAKSDRQKALIYIDMAQMHRISKQENNALVAFSKAENLDRSNSDLFEKWAFTYYLIGDVQEAMNKMLVAVKLKATKEYQLKAQYYTKRVIEPDFNMKLGDWLKKQGQENIPRLNSDTPEKSFSSPFHQKPVNPNFGDEEKKTSYSKFTKQFGIGDLTYGKISYIDSRFGVFVKFEESGATGLIHHSSLPKGFDMQDEFKNEKTLKVKVIKLIDEKLNINLELAEEL